MEHDEVKNKAIRGVFVLSLNTGLNLIAFVFLGAFLAPEVIGIYVAVSALMRFFTLFTNLGIGAALVQKKDQPDDQDLRTAFTFQILMVGVVVVVGLALTPYIAAFASLSRDAIFLYQVLVFTLLVSSLKLIPSILLERKLAFEKQVIPQVLETLVFNILIVTLAYRGFGVAAYSWAVLAASLVSLPVYYLVSPWRVGIAFDTSRAKKLISYGFAFQGKSFLAVLKDDLLVVFLTGIVGPAGIGYWGWAQKWAYTPFRLVVDNITKVTFPAYARVQHSAESLRRGLEKSLFAVSLLLFPAIVTMAAVLDKVILLVPRYIKWEPAITSFYFLCGAALLSGLSNILINFLDATGRVKTTLALMVTWVILTWVFTLVFVRSFGFTGISIASFAVACTIFSTWYLVWRQIKFNFLGSIAPPLIGATLMFVAIWLIVHSLPTSVLVIILGVSVGSIIYLGTVFLLAKDLFKENLSLLLRAVKK